MKSLFKTGIQPRQLDFVLLILRVSIASFMLVHGIPKMMKLFSDDPVKFADPIGIGKFASLALTVFAEVVCSFFILLGLGTRLAAIPLFITMLVAVTIVHSGDSFNDREGALQYLLIYLLLAVTGSGRYSIDHWLWGK